MIPDFEDGSGNLPPGVHWATWEEVVARYGLNATRQRQLEGLKAAIDELKRCGCKTLLLDGSFVTSKPESDDYDALWLREDVNLAILDPVLQLRIPPRTEQKKKYGGELFAVSEAQVRFRLGFVNIFQLDRNNKRKGIIAIDLRGVE